MCLFNVRLWLIIMILVIIKVEMFCGGFLFCLFVIMVMVDFFVDVICFFNVLIRVNFINDEM